MRNLNGRLDLCAINTATLGHREGLGAVADAVARAGFGGIAPWRRDLEGLDVAAAARRIRDSGLKVSGYCRSAYFTAPSGEARARALEENRQALREAAALGAACFVLVVGGLPAGSRDLLDARGQVRDGIAALLEEARGLGVPLAVEPLHPAYCADRACVNTLGQALALCEALDPAGGALALAVDVYHVWWDPALAANLAAAQGRITALHVCDWLVPTRDPVLDRGMMGDGVIDIAAIRAGAEAAGFSGLVEVEIFSSGNWWRRNMAEVLAVCAQRLQTLC